MEKNGLCINNCGFFGTSATMNMCSKCRKDMILKQEEHAKKLATSVGSEVGAPSCGSEVGEPSCGSVGPSRCTSCRKRVGLTGFSCRCGKLFCCVHRYSDKHDCPFDYLTASRDAIAKSNPLVKAQKLHKI